MTRNSEGHLLARPGWSAVVIVAIVMFAAAICIAVGIGVSLRNFGSLNEAESANMIAGLLSSMLAFSGVALSGFVGLQVLRRDKYEQVTVERRAVAAALGGECEDISGVFNAWSALFDKRLKANEAADVEIDFAEFPHISTLVYQDAVSRLGLLGPAEARATVVLYGRALVWKNFGRLTRTREEWTRVIDRHKHLSGMFRERSLALLQTAKIETGKI